MLIVKDIVDRAWEVARNRSKVDWTSYEKDTREVFARLQSLRMVGVKTDVNDMLIALNAIADILAAHTGRG
jgi:hypothetical protein